MSLLPQLERDLLEAHARLVSRRSRLRYWWLVRRAHVGAGSGPVGSPGRARAWAVAGVRALPTLLAVTLAVAVGGAFFLLVHARHHGLTAGDRFRLEQRYITTARQRSERRDAACASAAPASSDSSGTPSNALLSSLAALRGGGGAPTSLLDSFVPHLGPPVPTGVYVRFERLARTAILPATDSAPALTVPGAVGLVRVRDRHVRFYVVAAANVTGAASVPARCDAELTAALRGEQPRIPTALRTPTLRLAAQMLAQRRAAARQAEGILVFALSPTGGGTLIDGYTATTAQLRQRGAVSQAGFQWGTGTIFSGVVPDAVASVTLHFPAQIRAGKTTPPFTVAAHPVANVFVARLPRTWVPQSFGGISPDLITWRAANGTVIKAIHPSS
jgi:hypothetical protein